MTPGDAFNLFCRFVPFVSALGLLVCLIVRRSAFGSQCSESTQCIVLMGCMPLWFVLAYGLCFLGCYIQHRRAMHRRALSVEMAIPVGSPPSE